MTTKNCPHCGDTRQAVVEHQCDYGGPMTLDEAIYHAIAVAGRIGHCRTEHWQLAQWLRELKRYRQSSATGARVDSDLTRLVVPSETERKQ